MVVWMPGLILLGILSDPGTLPCAPRLPGQHARFRRLVTPPPNSSPEAAFEEEDTCEEREDPEEQVRVVGLSTAPRPRVDNPNAIVTSVPPLSIVGPVRGPAVSPRLSGVSLIYVICSLRI
jgi:hypothetical protein